MPETALSELMFRPVTELADLVRAGEVTARELVQTSLERIEELNPKLNAFVDVDADGALAAADAIGRDDGRPFAGVPIAIKNNRAVAGQRLTYGCSLMADFVPDYDHNVTRRLKDAGFVVVGTTTLPEYGILPVSEARLLGPTRNPWDVDRTPGGSSGGAAAAVAAGLIPAAHGNDGGGSVRIPAACCGLVGLKVQRGRVSLAPDLGDNFFTHDSVLTRTVGETAALLDLLSGYEVGDATWSPEPGVPFAEAAGRRPGPLRIATTAVPPLPDAQVDPMCVDAMNQAADLLRSLGHEVEEVELPWQNQEIADLFGAAYCSYISLSIAYSGLVAGREPTEQDMEAMSWAIWGLARSVNSVEFLGAYTQLQAVGRMLTAALDPYDALLTPALAERPLPIGTLDTSIPDLSAFTRSGYFTPFTAQFNVTGQPAISLPLYEGSDGLPLAVQLVGRPAGEGALLSLAAQVEEANPWADRRPPVS